MNDLMEEMARHVHEVWMRGRLSEGWRLGPRRDDGRKEHPCLVPYEELPENEKEYDRATALETLRFIESQGYEIRKKTDPKALKVTKDFKDFTDFKDPKVAKVPKLIRHSGNYRKLLTYQKADVIYQLTYYFCSRFLKKGDRTVDQMIQAARSGKQNIVEGCAASSTSTGTEIKLINVAKASFHELLEDFDDYLKTRNLPRWEENSCEWLAMRELGKTHNDAAYFLELAQTRGDDKIANMAIILLKQEDYLLYRQLERLERDFVSNGGFREKMMAVRKKNRGY